MQKCHTILFCEHTHRLTGTAAKACKSTKKIPACIASPQHKFPIRFPSMSELSSRKRFAWTEIAKPSSGYKNPVAHPSQTKNSIRKTAYSGPLFAPVSFFFKGCATISGGFLNISRQYSLSNMPNCSEH